MPKETEGLHLLFPTGRFADRSTKWLLEFGENVRGLLEIVAGCSESRSDRGDLVDRLDFSQLKPVNKSFIPDNLREQESDVIYLVPFRDGDVGDVWIYILIEHQSTIDVIMGFRVLFYMMQIWDSQRREWEDKKVPKSQWRFRPIIPIVLYTGEQKWETPIAIDAAMELPDVLKRFVPTFDILFLGVKAEDATNLTKTDHPFGWLLTVIQKENATKGEIVQAISQAVEHINTLPEEKLNEWKRVIFYLYLLIFHKRPRAEHDELKDFIQQQAEESKHREEGEEIVQTMAEYLVERGERRGKLETKREDILDLLAIRFNDVPESVSKKIRSFRSLKRLNDIFRQAATANTLDEIQL